MKKTFAFILFWLPFVGLAQSSFYTIKNEPILYSVDALHDKGNTDARESPATTHDEPAPKSEFPTKRIDEGSNLREELLTQYLSVSLPLREMTVNSAFGKRRNPMNPKKLENHKGIDLRAVYTETFSMLPGVVEKTGEDKRSGRYVTLRHGAYTVSYCHLSQILCKKGETVAPGQTIGITGNTGRSTGPHLHLTIKFKGKHIDPTILIGGIYGLRNDAAQKIRELDSRRTVQQ